MSEKENPTSVLKRISRKLKERWDIDSNLQLVLILVVFAITGSTSVKVARPVLDLLNIHAESMSGWIYWPLRIIIIFPIYQAMLLVFAFLFGQFKFFWEFEKRMFGRMAGKKTK